MIQTTQFDFRFIWMDEFTTKKYFIINTVIK